MSVSIMSSFFFILQKKYHVVHHIKGTDSVAHKFCLGKLKTQFYILIENEDPYNHLNDFHVVCQTLKYENFSDDDVKLRLFPFSLKDRARSWLILYLLIAFYHGNKW